MTAALAALVALTAFAGNSLSDHPFTGDVAASRARLFQQSLAQMPPSPLPSGLPFEANRNRLPGTYSAASIFGLGLLDGAVLLVPELPSERCRSWLRRAAALYTDAGEHRALHIAALEIAFYPGRSRGPKQLLDVDLLRTVPETSTSG